MSNDSRNSKTPTAEQVTERLRMWSELSGDAAAVAKVPRVDMSPEAVTARLRELSELSELCARLGELGRALRSSTIQ